MAFTRIVRATVLGAAKSGKTCLLRKLANKEVQLDQYFPTMGSDFERLNFPDDLQIEVTEASDERRMSGFLPMYHRGINVILLTWDSEAIFEEQLEKLSAYKKSCDASNTLQRSYILVFTKGDVRRISDEQIAQAKALLNISDSVKSSAKSNDWVPQLNHLLIKAASKLSPREKFELAVKLLNQGAVMQDSATKINGEEFVKSILQLQETISHYSEQEKDKIADSVLKLSGLVANKSKDIATAIPEFHTEMLPYISKCSLMKTVVGFILGAAAGMLAGTMAGAVLLGTAGVWCSMWLSIKKDPILNMEKQASSILSLSA